MCITTLRLFGTLLRKGDEQVLHSLVLRPLLSRSYVVQDTAHSPLIHQQRTDGESSRKLSAGPDGDFSMDDKPCDVSIEQSSEGVSSAANTSINEFTERNGEQRDNVSIANVANSYDDELCGASTRGADFRTNGMEVGQRIASDSIDRQQSRTAELCNNVDRLEYGSGDAAMMMNGDIVDHDNLLLHEGMVMWIYHS